MKVLTIKQPWASLIMFAGKDIENRDWAAPRHLIGQRIGIHSSKKRDKMEFGDALWMLQDISMNPYATMPDESEIFGCILGTVELVGCVTAAYCKSPWFAGDYGFMLRDPQPFKTPIPIRGALGFWEWVQPATETLDGIVPSGLGS